MIVEIKLMRDNGSVVHQAQFDPFRGTIHINLDDGRGNGVIEGSWELMGLTVSPSLHTILPGQDTPAAKEGFSE